MTVWTILGALVTGGLTACAVVGAGTLVLQGGPSGRARAQVLGICLVAPMIVAWYAAEPLGNAIEDRIGPPTGPIQDVQRYYDRQARRDPVLGPKLAGLDQAEARGLAWRMATKGLAYLDDASLQRRSEVIVQLLRVGSRGVAIGLYDGHQDPEQFMQALERLEPKDRNDWFGLSLAAMRAGVEGGPKPKSTEADRAEAMQALAAKLEPATGARFLQILANPHPTAMDEAFACKLLYGNLHRLDARQRRKLNRALANL